jgi:hypothetical protein
MKKGPQDIIATVRLWPYNSYHTCKKHINGGVEKSHRGKIRETKALLEADSWSVEHCDENF